MPRRRILWGISLAVWGLMVAKTNALSVEARVDKTQLTLDDTVTFELAFDGSPSADPALPPLPGFRVVSQGQSRNIQLVNGHMTQEVVFQYILEPTAPGRYTLPAITVPGAAPTAPLEITVSGNANAPSASPPATGEPFITTTVDKHQVYVGEPLTLTFRFYHRGGLMGQPHYDDPAVEGFLAEDPTPQRNSRQLVQGVPYQVVEISRRLYAASPGAATIGPAELTLSVPGRSRQPLGGLFDNFFMESKPLTLRSNPIPIKALPLPPGAPEGFKGDVGHYTLEASLDRRTVALNEPVTLLLTVKGDGNLKALSAPTLPPVNGLKIYETIVGGTPAGSFGTKTFQTVLKPMASGTLTLPPLKLVFFNPSSQRYEISRTHPLTLSVQPGSPTPLSETSPGESVTVHGADIHFFPPRHPLRRRGGNVAEDFHFFYFNLIPAFLLLAAWGWNFWHRRDRRLSPLQRSRRASVQALGSLRRWRKGGAPSPSLADLSHIFHAYIADKIGRPAPGLTWDEVQTAFQNHGVALATQEALHHLWDILDQARFAPVGDASSSTEEKAQQFEQLLREVDLSWK